MYKKINVKHSFQCVKVGFLKTIMFNLHSTYYAGVVSSSGKHARYTIERNRLFWLDYFYCLQIGVQFRVDKLSS